MTSSIDLSKRHFLKGAATAGVGVLVISAGPCNGPSKEKVVKVTDFVIDLSREATPLLELLGAKDLAEQIEAKVIPALEKLKQALSTVDIPGATSTLGTVRNVLSGLSTAIRNLPESPRRTTIVGILASINVLLLTVEAFVDSEMSVTVKSAVGLSSQRRTLMTEKIDKAFEASKP